MDRLNVSMDVLRRLAKEADDPNCAVLAERAINEPRASRAARSPNHQESHNVYCWYDPHQTKMFHQKNGRQVSPPARSRPDLRVKEQYSCQSKLSYVHVKGNIDRITSFS